MTSPEPGNSVSLPRIEAALESVPLDPKDFEIFATDVLSRAFPGLCPIPGGSDGGRDADLFMPGQDLPVALAVTTSRTFKGIRENMVKGIESILRSGSKCREIVLANPASLNDTTQRKLKDAAADKGFSLRGIFGRERFASELGHNGAWRFRLLGLPSSPASIAPLPRRLAESRWVNQPLVGRGAELIAIIETDRDLILSGVPGSGKTRLLAEVPGVFFICDPADAEQVCRDIVTEQPAVLAVDDAAGNRYLLEKLLLLRSQEPDLKGMRIVVVCWPHQVEQAKRTLTEPAHLELPLLPRKLIGQIVRGMGVQSVSGVQVILDQAEGRPGWAVALADLAISSDNPDWVSGRHLLGEVDGYFARAGVSDDERDLLAIVAALGGVRESEISTAAVEAGLKTTAARRALDAASKGGLVDVDPKSGPDLRYVVRPPMLAQAIAAHYLFEGTPPSGAFEELAIRWPQRTREIATVCFDAARMGSQRALQLCDQVFDHAVGDVGGAVGRLDLLERYASINAASSERAVQILGMRSNCFDIPGWQRGTVTDLVRTIALQWVSTSALTLLLEISLSEMGTGDFRAATDRFRSLCRSHHPDLPITLDLRRALIEALDNWRPGEEDAEVWLVKAHAARALLDPETESTSLSPEDPNELNLRSGVLPIRCIQEVRDELWPDVARQFETSPRPALAVLIDASHDWSSVSRRWQDSGSEQVALASAVGRAMIVDLVGLCTESPGLLARIAQAAGEEEVLPPTGSNLEFDLFFDTRGVFDEFVQSGTHERVQTEAESWAEAPLSDVCDKLVFLKRELALTKWPLPSRASVACAAFARVVSDPEAFTRMALDRDLFPEAAPALRRLTTAYTRSRSQLLQLCLDRDEARSVALQAMLRRVAAPEYVDQAMATLVAADVAHLELLFAREDVSDEVQSRLLSHGAPRVASACALLIFNGAQADATSDEVRGILRRPEWASAISQLPLTSQGQISDYAASLTRHLATEDPETLLDLFANNFGDQPADEGPFYLDKDLWVGLGELHHSFKDALFLAWPEGLIRLQLVGILGQGDVSWLTGALASNLLSTEDVLSAAGLGVGPSLSDLAQLLVPRGVEPLRIAETAQFGTHFGEASARFGSLVQQFCELADAADPSIASVGAAGAGYYRSKLDFALEEERRQSVTGDKQDRMLHM